jgi:undecaprenyl diphosphate synthase
VLPAHVGIIMDGNGRWAEQQGKPRTYGHKHGITAAKRIIKAAIAVGIPNITLYTFSTENWSRSPKEVNFLMKLLRQHLRREADFYHNNRIRVLHAGEIDGLPEEVAKELRKAIDATQSYEAINAVLAINYGGRDEVVRAVNRILREDGSGPVTKEAIGGALDNPEIPDPDLIIRTAGEQRLSNFLLWESAYSEYYFSSKLWPEWDAEDLREALRHFAGRKRKFGGSQ